jgi:hypothetical protein
MHHMDILAIDQTNLRLKTLILHLCTIELIIFLYRNID